ncbi:PTS sugar transporter subunit IIA [bacterium]|nr:PTS sugar transporter subunit IIA [bacterium]
MSAKTMTLQQVADRMRLSERAVTHLAERGELGARKTAGHWRFRPEAVDAWVARNQPPALTPLPAAATGVAAGPSLVAALSPLRINLRLMGADADAVLRELVRLVVPPHEKRLSETLFKALKAREQLCSTCVNEGIAVPHSRNALIGVVAEPVLAYGRHPEGIAFGALDGKPVCHFFLLCAPSVRQHLQLLARLIRLVADPRFRAGLAAAAAPETILRSIGDGEQQLVH